MVFPILRQSAAVTESIKSQIPMFNDQNRFGILKLGPRPTGGEFKRSADNFGIVICLGFVICYLAFFLQ